MLWGQTFPLSEMCGWGERGKLMIWDQTFPLSEMYVGEERGVS
jgi:hypothetical protein